MVVIVEIFVTQRNAKDALRDQVAHRVFDTLPNPVIPEARADTIQQTDPLIDLAKQQSTTVASESTAVKSADYLTSPRTVKFKLIRNTLCVHRPLFARSRVLAAEHNHATTMDGWLCQKIQFSCCRRG